MIWLRRIRFNPKIALWISFDIIIWTILCFHFFRYSLVMYRIHYEIIFRAWNCSIFMLLKMMIKDFSKLEVDLKISCMYFRVFKKFRVCTCIHDTRYTIHDIDYFRVYTVTSLFWIKWLSIFLLISNNRCGCDLGFFIYVHGASPDFKLTAYVQYMQLLFFSNLIAAFEKVGTVIYSYKYTRYKLLNLLWHIRKCIVSSCLKIIVIGYVNFTLN